MSLLVEGGEGGGSELSCLVFDLLKPGAAKKENLSGACAYSGGGAKGDGPTTKQTQFFFVMLGGGNT